MAKSIKSNATGSDKFFAKLILLIKLARYIFLMYVLKKMYLRALGKLLLSPPIPKVVSARELKVLRQISILSLL